MRLIYVEMLGHDASFGYMKAVEMAASTNLLHKRVGALRRLPSAPVTTCL